MDPTSPFISTLHRWISVVMHNSMLNLTRFARERGYSMSQLMALNFVSHQGSCGISDIGDEMGISNPAASQLLDRLVQQKLVLRTEDPADRRSKLIVLTAEGQAVLAESLLARHGWLTNLESSLTAEELNHATQALDILIKKAKQVVPPLD